jgi:hypothetical protein
VNFLISRRLPDLFRRASLSVLLRHQLFQLLLQLHGSLGRTAFRVALLTPSIWHVG